MSKKDAPTLKRRLKAGGLALAELQKSLRFLRLYPREHPLCIRSIGEACGRLSGFLEEHGALEAEVGREGLYLDGELVLESGDQSSDLTEVLFPEGVRQLGFAVGLTEGELEELVAILAAKRSEVAGAFAADLVTALWRRDFEHVTCQIHDQLSPTTLVEAHDPAMVGLREEVGEVAGAMPGYAGDAAAAALLEAVEARAAEADEPAAWRARFDRVEEHLATPAGAERRRLRDALRRPEATAVLERAHAAVVWTARQGVGEPDDVGRFLAGAVLTALRTGDVQRALRLLEQGEEVEGGRITTSVRARLGAREALETFSRALEVHRDLDADGLVGLGMGYLTRLGPEVVPGVCALYPAIGDPAVRRVFRRLLSVHVEVAADRIEPLTRHPDPQVVKEAVGILALGGDGSTARRILAAAAEDPHATRGSLAREALDVVTGERRRRKLVARVKDDPDRRTRIAALAELMEEGSPKTFEDLRELVADPELTQRDDEEILLLFRALGKLGGLRSVRVLSEIARKRSLFRRRDTMRLRGLAESSLASMRRRRPQ